MPDSKPLATKTRSITHRRIKEPIYPVKLTRDSEKSTQTHPELHWILFDRLDAITLSGPHRKWVKELLSSNLTRPD